MGLWEAQGFCVRSNGCEVAHFQNYFGDGAVVVVPMELGDRRPSRPSHCPALAKDWEQLKCYPVCLAHPRLGVQPSALLVVRQNSILCRGWNSVSPTLQIFEKNQNLQFRKKNWFSFLSYFSALSLSLLHSHQSEVLRSWLSRSRRAYTVLLNLLSSQVRILPEMPQIDTKIQQMS